jgi:putative spermidine/putrescine transport system substrate-binding protein
MTRRIATNRPGMGRRSALQLAGTAIGSGAVGGFPTIWAQKIKEVTLRQFGTGVSNLNAIAEKVRKDLVSPCR